jgi:hypothetical protein
MDDASLPQEPEIWGHRVLSRRAVIDIPPVDQALHRQDLLPAAAGLLQPYCETELVLEFRLPRLGKPAHSWNRFPLGQRNRAAGGDGHSPRRVTVEEEAGRSVDVANVAHA